MSGRPARLTSELERSQRNKLHPSGQKGKAAIRPSSAGKADVGDVPEIQAPDRGGAEGVQPVAAHSGIGGDGTDTETVADLGRVGLHFRGASGTGTEGTPTVPRDLQTPEGQAVESGWKDTGPRKKTPLGLRLVGWLTRRVTKHFTREEAKPVPDDTATLVVSGAEGQAAPVKFIVSKQVTSVITHTAVPLLCTIVFNLVRIMKPDLLWATDTDPEAVNQVVNTVNEMLLGASGLAAAWGSIQDLNKFRIAKKAANGNGTSAPPTV